MSTYHIYRTTPTIDNRDVHVGSSCYWVESHCTLGWAQERATRLQQDYWGDADPSDFCGFADDITWGVFTYGRHGHLEAARAPALDWKVAFNPHECDDDIPF